MWGPFSTKGLREFLTWPPSAGFHMQLPEITGEVSNLGGALLR